MKGLLIKDLRLMMAQKTSVLMVLVIGVFLILSEGDVSFGIGYLTFVGGIFAMSTMSYDAFENGMAFLMTLPMRRKVYVLEKYVFIIGASAVLGLLMTALGLAIFGAGMSVEEIKGIIMTALVSVVTVAVMMSVMIPIQIHFGPEKSRIVMIVMAAGVFGLIAVVEKMLSGFQGESAIIRMLSDLRGVQLGIALTVLVAVIMGISIMISVKLLEKKEY